MLIMNKHNFLEGYSSRIHLELIGQGIKLTIFFGREGLMITTQKLKRSLSAEINTGVALSSVHHGFA